MGKRPKIGLALGGGGARGLAHIGVLKVLERERIPIDLIMGTSIGAVVGAAYAVSPDAVSLERKVLEFFHKEGAGRSRLKRLGILHPHSPEKTDLMHRVVRIAEKHFFISQAILKKAMVTEEDMLHVLRFFLPDISIQETAIPYAAIAVDLVSGQEVVFREGPLIRAVRASCAVPGFLPPVEWNRRVLVDGAVIDVVPAGAAKDAGADVVIGVDVGLGLCQDRAIEDGIDAINRAAEIMSFHLNIQSRERADVLIEPPVRGIEWTDFLSYEDLIREGERAAESNLGQIRSLLHWQLGRRALEKLRQIIMRLSRRRGKEKGPLRVFAKLLQ